MLKGEIYVSASYLSHIVKVASRRTVMSFIEHALLDELKRRLKMTEDSLGQIAFDLKTSPTNQPYRNSSFALRALRPSAIATVSPRANPHIFAPQAPPTKAVLPRRILRRGSNNYGLYLLRLVARTEHIRLFGSGLLEVADNGCISREVCEHRLKSWELEGFCLGGYILFLLHYLAIVC